MVIAKKNKAIITKLPKLSGARAKRLTSNLPDNLWENEGDTLQKYGRKPPQSFALWNQGQDFRADAAT